MMFVLNRYQRYIAEILDETRVLRVNQVHRLLTLLDAGVEEYYARRLLSQLQNMNRAYWIDGDTVTLPHLRNKPIDTKTLLAVDIMLDLLVIPPLALSCSKPPFVLSFLTQRGKKVLSFGVAVVTREGAAELQHRLHSVDGNPSVIFLLSDIRDSGLVRTELSHFFAVLDRGKLRYFKGKSG